MMTSCPLCALRLVFALPQVRTLSRTLGLPNWNHAASPCLRSRLALGVQATPERLALVEKVPLLTSAGVNQRVILHPVFVVGSAQILIFLVILMSIDTCRVFLEIQAHQHSVVLTKGIVDSGNRRWWPKQDKYLRDAWEGMEARASRLS